MVDQIILSEESAAIIINSDLSVELLIPNGICEDEESTVSENVLLCAAVAKMLNDEECRKKLLNYLLEDMPL